MITILISDDELKAKEALAKMLEGQGYALSGDLAQDNIIRLVKKDCISNFDFIKDKVIEIEDSLYHQKKGLLYKTIVEAIEKPLIEHTLERTEGNQLKAARALGINRNTMRSKIKKLGIDVDRWKITK